MNCQIVALAQGLSNIFNTTVSPYQISEKIGYTGEEILDGKKRGIHYDELLDASIDFGVFLVLVNLSPHFPNGEILLDYQKRLEKYSKYDHVIYFGITDRGGRHAVYGSFDKLSKIDYMAIMI